VRRPGAGSCEKELVACKDVSVGGREEEAVLFSDSEVEDRVGEEAVVWADLALTRTLRFFLWEVVASVG
jgi:hypothetical protein